MKKAKRSGLSRAEDYLGPAEVPTSEPEAPQWYVIEDLASGRFFEKLSRWRGVVWTKRLDDAHKFYGKEAPNGLLCAGFDVFDLLNLLITPVERVAVPAYRWKRLYGGVR